MKRELSDRDLQDLFNRHLPPAEMPPGLAEGLRARVLNQVAITLHEVQEEPVLFEQTAAQSRLRTSARPAMVERRPQGFWGWLSSLRWAPTMALAGATVAVALLFFYFLPQLLPADFVPAPQTGSTTDVLAVASPAALQSVSAAVSVEDGTATLFHKQSGETEDLESGTAAQLLVGDELFTLSGTARITYFEGQSTVVEPGARLELAELGMQNDGTQVTVVVHVGATRHTLGEALGSDDHFVVRSPSAQASVVGTDFRFETRSKTATYVAVSEGVVLVEMGGQRAAVIADQELLAVLDEPLQPVSLVPTAAPAPAAVAELPQASPTVEPSPTATATETPEATATASPPPTATATDTPAPTATATNPPTATPLPTATATHTPALTATPTATATYTPAPTATATHTPAPTATPIPVTVGLVAPEDRAAGSADQGFRWSTSGPLAEGEAYELVFWKDGQNPLANGFGVAEPTRATSVTVDLKLLDDRLGGLLDPGDYRWGVLRVRVSPYERLEFMGESRLFRYTSSSNGASPSSGE